jgi:hypothetical protein
MMMSNRPASPARSHPSVVATVLAAILVLTVCGAARADFGPAPSQATVTALNSDGTIDTQAGSHPFSFSVHFALKTDESGTSEGGSLRDIKVELPPGLFGNPHTMPTCSPQEFDGDNPICSGSTQLGRLHAVLPGVGEVEGPVYNLSPPPGVAFEMGFKAEGFTVLQYASVLSDEGYGVQVYASDLPLEATIATETIWGTPEDPAHDAERTCVTSQGVEYIGCSATGVLEQAFLTLPTSCVAAPETTLGFDSTQNPGVFVSETLPFVDAGDNPAPLSGCDAVPFSPSVVSVPTSGSADSASGIDFGLTLPNQGLLAAGGVAESEPVKTEVELPRGIVINPSAADGQGVCTPAQYQAADGEQGQGCPESSKVGTLVARTPLLEEVIEGSVYLAAPHENPFGSLLALYIVAKARQRGVLIKQAGEVKADSSTGQLTATFAGLPPLPYSSFEFDLREGPRAPLVTPQTCGTYATEVKLYPFSNPGVATERSADFTISSGADGGACAASEGGLPNSPDLMAGTVSPVAGVFSPLVFEVSREDGSQHLGSINGTLPEGVLGDLAGVAYCSDAQIAAAAARRDEGEGAVEQGSPSCPESSQVGVVNITAGAGSQPYVVQGKAYLAGPYKNAPLSLAIITPAIAGPFDLGTVVVRVALYINPSTAQISAVSDPLPTILDGIPLDIRSVSLEMNRAGFTFNPTSCEPMSITGQAVSTLGQTAGLSNRFQVGGCAGLPFKPALSTSTAGKASKADGASLSVKLSQKSGEADIHKVDLALPIELPSRLSTLQQACSEAQFNTNPAGCPPGAFIGTAMATTPILNVPLAGPAVLVSHGGAAFPDVEFLLQADERGSVIQINLDGKTDIKKGITYSRFETVPDAPISSFETNLTEGPHSILGVNLPASAKFSLCGQKLSIPATITGQNGAVVSQSTPVAVTGCSTTLSFTHSVEKRTVTLSVYAPAAGKLTASGKGLTTVSKTAKGQEKVTVTLKQKKTGKLKTAVKVLFKPSKGKQQTKTTKLTLKK